MKFCIKLAYYISTPLLRAATTLRSRLGADEARDYACLLNISPSQQVSRDSTYGAQSSPPKLLLEMLQVIPDESNPALEEENGRRVGWD